MLVRRCISHSPHIVPSNQPSRPGRRCGVDALAAAVTGLQNGLGLAASRARAVGPPGLTALHVHAGTVAGLDASHVLLLDPGTHVVTSSVPVDQPRALVRGLQRGACADHRRASVPMARGSQCCPEQAWVAGASRPLMYGSMHHLHGGRRCAAGRARAARALPLCHVVRAWCRGGWGGRGCGVPERLAARGVAGAAGLPGWSHRRGRRIHRTPVCVRVLLRRVIMCSDGVDYFAVVAVVRGADDVPQLSPCSRPCSTLPSLPISSTRARPAAPPPMHALMHRPATVRPRTPSPRRCGPACVPRPPPSAQVCLARGCDTWTRGLQAGRQQQPPPWPCRARSTSAYARSTCWPSRHPAVL